MKPSDLPGLDRRPDTKWAQPMSWPVALSATALGLGVLVLVYWGAVISMVQTWQRSGTYAHGFIVFPLSAWLIWRQRAALAVVTPRPFWPGLPILGLLSCFWLFGHLATIQSFQEFAFVASVPLLIWTILGTRAAAAIGFPLAFTLFAWPFGEFFVPPMIDWTADFAVAALRLTGIPVYREGNNFVIPSGNWSVVDACSGIRYLIASFYGGCIFAYVSYWSWKRRLLFLGFSLAVPVVANWVRVYLIVLTGHLSDNRIATGIDHIIYGWVFFGIVISFVFYVGSRFSDIQPTAADAGSLRQRSARPVVGLQTAALTALAAISLPAIGPVMAIMLEPTTTIPVTVELAPPTPPGAWTAVSGTITGWEPPFPNPTASVSQVYQTGADRVGLYVAYYRNQRSGAKLLTYASTTLSDYDPVWRTEQRSSVTLEDHGNTYRVIERVMHSPTQKLLAWQWYWVEGEYTASAWDAKLMQARSQFLGIGDDSAAVVAYAPYQDQPVAARDTLRRFVGQARPAITKTLTDAANR